jgi:hypothetical protein
MEDCIGHVFGLIRTASLNNETATTRGHYNRQNQHLQKAIYVYDYDPFFGKTYMNIGIIKKTTLLVVPLHTFSMIPIFEDSTTKIRPENNFKLFESNSLLPYRTSV